MTTHRHRHKRTLTVHNDSRRRQKGDPIGALKLAEIGGDFNIDIDMPVAGTDPLSVSTSVTATGPITVNDRNVVRFQIWYTDSGGTDTAVDPAGLTITGMSSPYQWNISFTAPSSAAEYTFTIQAIYIPPLAKVPTVVTISAPFTTQ
jgi:hypothetical protein